ncbi:MAG TPA: nuclear transport factor 2 family protein [Bryocella sp.]|nr:nuclear transport factor 2 family protein [Bryocella sp.]
MPQVNRTNSWAAGEIAETITYLEQQWASAAKANDSARIAPLLADVLVEMDSDGTILRKPEVLARAKTEKWQVNEVSDIKVVVYGNMAVATGAWRGKGTSADGKAIDAQEHWLDTWHKNGKWQCIATASAPVKA